MYSKSELSLLLGVTFTFAFVFGDYKNIILPPLHGRGVLAKACVITFTGFLSVSMF